MTTKTMKKRKLNPKRLTLVLIVAGVLLVLLATFLLLKDSRSLAILGGLIKSNDQGKTVIDERIPDAEELEEHGDSVIAERVRKGSLLMPDAVMATSPVPETNLNILLIGPDVSESNYDTLMIASLNVEDHTVTLINIPRDIYVPYNKETISEIKQVSSHYGTYSALNKINAAHLLGKMLDYGNGKGPMGSSEIDFIADVVSEMFHLYVDDYLYVKPSTFRSIVDDFGGVMIDVPYRMRYTDLYQDLKIDLQPGLQHLDGAQAEGFVRYRKGFTDSGRATGISDNERKANQVAFMKAFADQHFNIGNIGKFIGLLENAEDYIQTSIDNKRLTSYASYAKSFAQSNYVINSIEVPTADLNLGGVSFLYMVVDGLKGFVLADGSTPEQNKPSVTEATVETTPTPEETIPTDVNGETIPTDSNGQPVQTDENGEPLSTNENGEPIPNDPASGETVETEPSMETVETVPMPSLDPGWEDGQSTETTPTAG